VLALVVGRDGDVDVRDRRVGVAERDDRDVHVRRLAHGLVVRARVGHDEQPRLLKVLLALVGERACAAPSSQWSHPLTAAAQPAALAPRPAGLQPAPARPPAIAGSVPSCASSASAAARAAPLQQTCNGPTPCFVQPGAVHCGWLYQANACRSAVAWRDSLHTVSLRHPLTDSVRQSAQRDRAQVAPGAPGRAPKASSQRTSNLLSSLPPNDQVQIMPRQNLPRQRQQCETR